jgi:hypothetical protein
MRTVRSRFQFSIGLTAAMTAIWCSLATERVAAAPEDGNSGPHPARPPACEALSPPEDPSAPPPELKPTTITAIGQAYYCILDNYFSGRILDSRSLLVPAFAALTQELQRRGLDQSEATLPALAGSDHSAGQGRGFLKREMFWNSYERLFIEDDEFRHHSIKGSSCDVETDEVRDNFRT